MSNMAQGRDLSDPRTAEALAAIVQTQERLKLLLIADGRPTSAPSAPACGTAGRASCCAPSTGRPRSCSAAAIRRSTARPAFRRRRRRCARALPGWSDPEFDAYAQRHYPAYWLKVEPERQIAHAKLLYAMAADMRSLATEVATDAFHGVTAITVVAPDHPRLLSGIAGACAAAGANIVDAQIFTTTDGLALDTIFVSRAFEHDEDELRRGRRIADEHRENRCAAKSGWRRSRRRRRRGMSRARRLRDRTRSHDRQHAVEPLHGRGGFRARPARPAARPHRLACPGSISTSARPIS